MTTIAEEVLLLAYSEDEGRQLVGSSELDAALGGALLAELAVNGRIDLADKKVTVLDPTPLGDEELDATLARIAAESKERKPDWWVYKLHSAKLRKRLLTRLAEQGVLREEQRKILGIFPSTRYPESDPRVEEEIRERVRSVLSGAVPDERVAVLVAVLHAAKVDRKAFPDASRERIKEITEGDWAGKAVAKTIAAINSAVMTAVIAGSVAASSSASSG
ncbi:GOLPH3/VPS74 family protein [Streptosporangium sp. NBC_01756]|uniref:GOLPH3/VPS74 family protein n=1 Tax=Streptosporangium sp. NBC_01756 TaxID=2975950 RepID=UPI002DDC4DFE|nr:GPP34 family phosphoprotein [Streptosporangium sp. NBC_01756]WSC90318.1 GPP34 family phosphoprotein [Streptosporangium sp. NBC_01756]